MREKIEILCVGAAVVDILAQPVGQRTAWREKQRIESIQLGLGGDAANQSVRLADLGHSVALVTCVGSDDNGKMLQSALERRGVSTVYLRERPDCATGTALVLVDEQGERHTFSAKGAHSTLDKASLPTSLPDGCRAISLASLFSMPVLERDGLLELLRQAKAQGVLAFADLAADKFGQGLSGVAPFLPWIDYFLPSLYDALEMTGASTAEAAAAIYRDLGAKRVVIKCGRDGCYFDGEEKGWASAVPVEPVDTTGAGDCMAALFLSRILAGDDLAAACRFACGGASLSTLFLGASSEMLSRARIERWVSQQTI